MCNRTAPLSPPGFVKTQIGGPHSISDLIGLEWGPTMCVPNEFPGAAGAAGLGTTLGEPLTYNNKMIGSLGENLGSSGRG